MLPTIMLLPTKYALQRQESVQAHVGDVERIRVRMGPSSS